MKAFELWDGAWVGRKLDRASSQRLGAGSVYTLFCPSTPNWPENSKFEPDFSSCYAGVFLKVEE